MIKLEYMPDLDETAKIHNRYVEQTIVARYAMLVLNITILFMMCGGGILVLQGELGIKDMLFLGIAYIWFYWRRTVQELFTKKRLSKILKDAKQTVLNIDKYHIKGNKSIHNINYPWSKVKAVYEFKGLDGYMVPLDSKAACSFVWLPFRCLQSDQVQELRDIILGRKIKIIRKS